MIIARQVADGEGYTLPLLQNKWAYPYILAIGPTLILPVALSIKLLGFSVAAARIPMVLYIAATTVVSYLFVQKITDRRTAQWSTALLLSLSTFINTGKPVMGEIPGFFFLLLGLFLLLKKERSHKRDIVIGLCFGLSVLTKLTFGLIYPAIGVAWFVAAFRREKTEMLSLTLIGCVAALVFAPWRLLEMTSFTGLSKDFAFLFSGEEGEGFQLLGGNLNLLLRPQYLYFGVMLLLGTVGLWLKSGKFSRSVWLIIVTLIAGFTLYFLSSFGWYRHLLPAHLLLIPFATTAVLIALPRSLATVLLLFFLCGQGYWQWDHRGSSRSTASAEAAEYVTENMQDADLIVQIASIYVRLDRNPHWLFLTNPILTSRLPEELVTFTDELQCHGLIRGKRKRDEDVLTIGKRYVVIPPPEDCS
jgi:4-amino-4-deoxy-L-arabinose transferase-like glycosyltransferase